jgi:hypothetical protein
MKCPHLEAKFTLFLLLLYTLADVISILPSVVDFSRIIQVSKFFKLVLFSFHFHFVHLLGQVKGLLGDLQTHEGPLPIVLSLHVPLLVNSILKGFKFVSLLFI